MDARPVAVYDANVLYPAQLRDLLMRLAISDLVRPHWSDAIHDEWMRNVHADRADVTWADLEYTRNQMDRARPDACVEGYQQHIEALTLPDPDDRHVLAVAIHIGADYIVTFNLRDFPASQLDPHGVEAIDPDAFVGLLMDRDPERVVDTAPVSLPLAFEVSEEWAERALGPGACARITTGQPVPPGADAVIRKERTERDGDAVRIQQSVPEGQNIRPVGENVAANETIIEAGVVVTPSAASLMAAVGTVGVSVRQKPRVALLVTGDELVPPSEAPGPGQIRDANGPALAMQVRTAGGVPDLRRARDERGVLRRVLDAMQSADVLCVSGGMSVGTDDLVHEVLQERGAEWLFANVRQRPGKPFGFGQLDDVPVFGLPGNPVSAAVCFEVYVRSALAQMLGRTVVHRPRLAATLAEPLRAKAGYHYFARGVAHHNPAGCLEVRPTGAQGAGISRSMWEANCLIHVEEAVTNPRPGDQVHIEWLDDGAGVMQRTAGVMQRT